ncbi:MAG: ABC transporter substrate-binding protein, partial [Burkholderiales bacterium]
MIVRLLTAALIVIATSVPAGAAELVIGLGADVTSIDPHNNNAAPNNSIAEQIFNKLIENDAKQNPKPALAESWRTVDDLTWEFKLRRGVKFHDGSDFTAADVAYSIERPGIINAPGGFTIYTRSIVEKTIVDPYTIRLKTATPYPNMPTDMAGLIIVSSKAAKGATNADFDSGKATVGTGPWKFVRYLKGDRIELVRNDNYWGPKPAWDKVTFRLITSDPSRIAALLSGDVQMIEAVPPADYAKLKTNKDITIFTTISNRIIHLHLDSNRDKSPFMTDKSG